MRCERRNWRRSLELVDVMCVKLIKKPNERWKTLTWIEFDWWAGKEFQRIQIEGRKEDTWANEEQRGIWEEWRERKEKKRCSDNVALGTTGPDPQLTSSVWPWRQAHIVTVKKWARQSICLQPREQSGLKTSTIVTPRRFGGPANVFREESPLSVREEDRRGRRSSPFRGGLGACSKQFKFWAPKIATLDVFKKKVR